MFDFFFSTWTNQTENQFYFHFLLVGLCCFFQFKLETLEFVWLIVGLQPQINLQFNMIWNRLRKLQKMQVQV